MGNNLKSENHPEHWEFKKVKEVAIINEENISTDDNFDQIEYIEISKVNKGDVSDVSLVDFEEAPSRARRKVKANDILISTVRPNLEHYSFIKEAKENTIASTGFAVIRAKEINPRFLYYVLTSQRYTDYFSMIAEGHTSAYPAMNPDVIENVEIPFPPEEEQKRIAHILGTLDDKIELNKRMSQTLEEIARAVFKSWFVDFDPVRAKMAGEPFAKHAKHPLPDEVMALFPDELVESELGMIPKGWEVSKIKNFGEIITGKTPSTKVDEYYDSKDVPFIKIPDMHNNLIISKTENHLSSKGAKSQSKKFLPPNSICVSCIATPGLVSLTSRLSQTNQQINSIIPNNNNLSFFLLFSMDRKGQEIRMSGSGGSVISNLNKTDFSNIEILSPEQKILLHFTKVIHSLVINIRELSSENQLIKQLRNTLISYLF